jgi:hypothetical protein
MYLDLICLYLDECGIIMTTCMNWMHDSIENDMNANMTSPIGR